MPSITEDTYKLAEVPRLYEFSNLSFSLTELADEVREQYFPEIELTPPVFFGKMKRLAFCEVVPERKPVVIINSVFNNRTTPIEIIQAILIHEFLHIVVPCREISGKVTAHPPEFAEAEQKRCPEIGLLWAWLRLTFLNDLIVDREAERASLKNLRFHRRPDKEFMTMSVLRELLGDPALEQPGECF